MVMILAMALFAGPSAASAPVDPVADAKKKCEAAARAPAVDGRFSLPVVKYDECIVAEANRWPIEYRMPICMLGRSGGSEGSTVEVYMADGKCRTDYE